MARYRRLREQDLPRSTVALARALIGCMLVRDSTGGRVAGRIVETEAYALRDPASHAYRGKTKRNASMFLPPFHAYVYRIYGTAFCVNVSSESSGEGAAVLLRALEPQEGLASMESRRKTTRLLDLCRGPGRLCKALDIDLALDGIELLGAKALWLGAPISRPGPIGRTVRIGITKGSQRTLRFFERGNPFVSGPKRLLQ